MLTKKTSKNQVTLPRSLLDRLPQSDYFDATVENGALVLRPVRVAPVLDLERVRDRVAAAGATAADVRAAVRWARRKK